MKNDTAVIVNLTDQSWTLQRTYGTFTIQAAKPGVSYSLTRVTSRTALMDLGDKRVLQVPITAAEVAHDLCREMNSDGGEDSYFGVFVAEGHEPSEQELLDARARLAAFYRCLVVAADREWERSHSFLFINDVERRAAEYLGLEKEWYYRAAEMPDCPGCGEKVKPGVAVCKSCHAILDREKAAALGLAPSPREANDSVAQVLSRGSRGEPKGFPLDTPDEKSQVPRQSRSGEPELQSAGAALAVAPPLASTPVPADAAASASSAAEPASEVAALVSATPEEPQDAEN